MSTGIDRFIMEQALKDRIGVILRELGEDAGWQLIERCIQYNLDQQHSNNMQQARILAQRGLSKFE